MVKARVLQVRREPSQRSLSYLVNDKGLNPDNIIAFGRSLGTAVMTNLASREKVAGLIIQSPPMSALRILQRTRFSMTPDLLCNIDRVRQKIEKPRYLSSRSHQSHVRCW
eukprot:Blabericola_migrator_1__4936@NODE_2574_length_2585_cov_336_116362_g1612_i0_p3_GENE_NODE_2574_length_2585_cov_336_116362_g1612_i0NODE_2574_length_2585_cov_336_116362_g1612_i0_p3_ORF_typecomplete_len110_score14_01DUF818/PF05677_12/3_6e07Hydrolase_4/PF12146_8/0_00057Peptidase_S9/PF00326_21/0_0016DUF1100/PF06500_11/0_0018DUF1057/PF06342_12/0_0025BAAT_C/PF08840_11/0_0042Abhydrolase_6/PF12697_7/0_0079Abhydrolase_3/PF07859_13/0_015Abhydrolase_2/PF02230_16/0_023Abhydrolase_1/PF00561_20/0_032Abhydrolase_